MVLQLRIDERLAYKQVNEGWVKKLGATHLIIADNFVAGNSAQRDLMMYGIPKTVKHLFATVDKAIEIVNDPKATPLKIFLIVRTPGDAIKIMNGVEGINDVIFGKFGIMTAQDSETLQKLCPSVILDAGNIALVKDILKRTGKEIYYQDRSSSDPVKLVFL